MIVWWLNVAGRPRAVPQDGPSFAPRTGAVCWGPYFALADALTALSMARTALEMALAFE